MSQRNRLRLASAIGAVCLVLAGVGYRLGWPEDRVGMLAGLGASALSIAIAWWLMPRWWRDQCEDEIQSPANQRYLREFWPWMVLYVVAIFGMSWLLRQVSGPQSLRAVIALVPVIPTLGVVRAMVRRVRNLDEFQRRIEVESYMIAGVAVPMLFFAAGFLQAAKVIDIPAAAAMLWMFPLTMLVYGIAKFLVTRRYR